MDTTVDLLIPVYNAYEELLDCLESVKRTVPQVVNIIILEDASTDRRVKRFIQDLDGKDERIEVILNKKNMGFVRTVNKGMKLHKRNDVVLLNTDTIVTTGWIEKLYECAYSQEEIATVTPLTNNGNGICSVPNFCQENKVPAGYSIRSFANLIERYSLTMYPKIPTAVGFCMFIKRKVLNKIGFFDEKTFGKGYGEEVDFSCRVVEQGYTNVLDDQTYIYHKGASSFTKERSKNLKEFNFQSLLNKHPNFEERWDNFCKTNPLWPIHANILFWLKYANSKLPRPVLSLLQKIYMLKACFNKKNA